MAELIRDHDWAATPLGPIEAWPQSLKTAVGTILAMPQPMWIGWGPDLIQLYNDGYISLLDAERHPAILGQPAAEAWAEIWHLMGPDLDAILAGGPAVSYADRLVPYRRSGEVRDLYFTYSYSSIPDEAAPSGVGGVLCLGVETTPAVALRASEERLKAALDAGHMAWWDWDPATDQVNASDTMDDLFGLMPGETFQSSAQSFQLVHPDDVDRHRAMVERAGALGESWHSEFRIIRPRDGAVAWLEERATVKRDPQTGTVHTTGIVWDITERKLAEAALRESEERYRLAVEATGLGRWELVPETGEFHTSAICNRHLGLPADARPTHEGHFETIHPDDHEMIYRKLRRAVEESGEFEVEYRVLHPGGDVRRVLSRARVLHNRGSAPDRLIGVTLDVTEARELEQERERTRARELTALAEAAERERISRELHDRVAHSIAVAHQSLELHAALAESAPERAAEKLDLARETTRRALEQTRALSAELKRLQEEELAGGMEAAFKTLLAESYVPDGVAVDLSFSGEESAIPKPVDLQVYLAIREALRNAVRHSGCSRIGITLRVRDREVYGCVEDDGEGFDPETVGKATPSWGVGLRSMRERAEMLGGSLRVNSSPGVGTRVELRVPLDGRLQSSSEGSS